MSIDATDVPPDTIVEVAARACPEGTTVIGRARTFDERALVVRTFSPDPTPDQEVPREEWANIKQGSRVRVECSDDVTVIGPLHKVGAGSMFRLATDGTYGVSGDAIARVYLLDEPADPDADLIEQIRARWLEDGVSGSEPRPSESLIRTAIAVVREHEAKQ